VRSKETIEKAIKNLEYEETSLLNELQDFNPTNLEDEDYQLILQNNLNEIVAKIKLLKWVLNEAN